MDPRRSRAARAAPRRPVSAGPEPPRTAPQPAKSNVEQEYIFNLQQQIHYLELQGKIIREKLAQPGPHLRNRSTTANPLMDKQLDLAAPLNEHIEGLRMKYIGVLEEHKRAMVAHEEEAAAAAEQLRAAEYEQLGLNERAKGHRTELARALATHERSLRARLNDVETTRQRTEELEAELAERRKDGAEWKEQYDALVARLADADGRIGQLQGEIKDARRSTLTPAMALEREKRVASLSADERKLQKQLRYLDELCLKRENDAQAEKDQQWTLETRAETAEAEVQRLRRDNEQAEADLRRAREDLANVQKMIGTTTTALDSLRNDLEQLQRENSVLGAEARVRLDKARRELADLTAACERLRSEQRTAVAEDEAARVDFETSKARYQEAHRRLAEATAAWKARELQLMDTQTNARRSEEERARVEEARDAAHTVLKALRNTHTELRTGAALLEREIAEREGLVEVDVNEFEALKETNERLAQTITALTSRFGTVGRTGLKIRRCPSTPARASPLPQPPRAMPALRDPSSHNMSPSARASDTQLDETPRPSPGLSAVAASAGQHPLDPMPATP